MNVNKIDNKKTDKSEPAPGNVQEPAVNNGGPDKTKKSNGERALFGLINVLVVVVVVIAGYLAWDRFFGTGEAFSLAEAPEDQVITAPTAVEPKEPALEISADAIPFAAGGASLSDGITRAATLITKIPARARVDVITYTVEIGDNLFGIADTFGLEPTTILWGNFDVLEGNAHLLQPDQVLNILPVNGTYYQWHEDDTLIHIADFFKAEPESILEYPGNRFDLTLSTLENPNIEEGSWLIIPDGEREYVDWGPPAITRQNPASARYYGAGHCGSVYEGAIGYGSFVWPTTARYISGYHYDPNIHPAIDIGGAIGNAIYASDSGVIVYAGWSDYGYGYLIVIDHGTGWQTAYAHLSAVGVSCGQSVYQGQVIGGLGSTGNSSGPHLHFEMIYQGTKPNPMNFLQ